MHTSDRSEEENNMGSSNLSKKIDGIFISKKDYIDKRDVLEESHPWVDLEKNIPEVKLNTKKSNYGLLILRYSFFTLLIATIIVLPIKLKTFASNIVDEGSSIQPLLTSAQKDIEENNFEEARNKLTQAQGKLSYIKGQIEAVGQNNYFLDNHLSFSDPINEKEAFVRVAYNLTSLGLEFLDEVKYFKTFEIGTVFDKSKDNTQLIEHLNSLSFKIQSNQPIITQTTRDLDALAHNSSLSDSQKNTLIKVSKAFNYYKENKEALDALTGSSSELLASSYDKKYLMVFQNNTELRPTGGFIGSYGIVTVHKGVISKIFVDSIYNPDGQLTQKITPPTPLQKITPYLAMRDANWDPDFPATAKQLIHFYEAEGGFTPDGVIAVDTNLFVNLLKITGPISVPQDNAVVTDENFISLTQYKTSIEYDPNENNPKKFIGDFAPFLLSAISHLGQDKQTEIYNVFSKSIISRDIQFYHPEERLESALDTFGVTGSIKNPPGDYLMMVDANIGGMKTNNEIETSVVHTIQLTKNEGTARHTVTVTRKHHGSFSWPSGTNYSYFRWYTPKDTTIIDSGGLIDPSKIQRGEDGMLTYSPGQEEVKKQPLDTTTEHEKTVFGGWTTVKPGETNSFSITYDTPVTLQPYQLYIQKQAGLNNTTYTLQVTMKSNSETSTLYSNTAQLSQDISVQLP
ncbi:MAG: DUF4012 domain-containing protein [Patescibacteria group bacterium]